MRKIESTDLSKFPGPIFDKIDSSPSLFLEYRALDAANSSGVNDGRPAFVDASLGQMATCVTFICGIMAKKRFCASVGKPKRLGRKHICVFRRISDTSANRSGRLPDRGVSL